MAHFILILLLALVGLPLALAGVVLGAVFPYFLLGAAGQLWWKWQLRTRRSPGSYPDVYPTERKLWSLESKSLAEVLSPAPESWREAG